jgi:hypothetical protein
METGWDLYLTDGCDVDVSVVEEEQVDGAADTDAVLAQRVVVLALRGKHGLLLVGA